MVVVMFGDKKSQIYEAHRRTKAGVFCCFFQIRIAYVPEQID